VEAQQTSHNPSIATILQATFNYSSEYSFIKNDDNIIGVLPLLRLKNHFVSVPHFSYGDIITTNDLVTVTDVLSQNNINNFEIRSFQKLSEHFDDSKVTSFLHLQTGIDEQFSEFKSKLRSQIRKGYKNELTIEIGNEELLEDFYVVYSKNMHELGSPVLGKVFFKNILQYYKYGYAKVFIVKYNGKAVGGSIVLTYQDFSEVCWASTLREYNRLSPNMVLYWEMIKFAIENNMKIFSFGRGSKGSSTLKFKQQWGTVEKQLYFNFSHPQKINIKRITFLSNIWAILPYRLTLFLGPKIAAKIY